MTTAMGGRKYLVTGGAGFLGSHLVEAIVARGDEAVVLDNLETGSLSNLEGVIDHPRLRVVVGSVLDGLLVDELAHHCDVIVHLAASTGVRRVVDAPLRSFTQNLRGSEEIIDVAHRYRCKLIIASTGEVYGKNAEMPLDEEANRVLGPPMAARWAYSVAKATEEILAYAYHRERGLDVVVVRLFNLAGPRQNPSYGTVIPRLVRQALAGEALTVFGDGQQTRCFCHVVDACDAMLGLLDQPDAVGRAFNVGGQAEVTILQLARRIMDLAPPVALGNGSRRAPSEVVLVPYEDAYSPGFEDMTRRLPDISRIRDLTGWEPTYTLDDILNEAISEAAAERHDVADPAAFGPPAGT